MQPCTEMIKDTHHCLKALDGPERETSCGVILFCINKYSFVLSNNEPGGVYHDTYIRVRVE